VSSSVEVLLELSADGGSANGFNGDEIGGAYDAILWNVCCAGEVAGTVCECKWNRLNVKFFLRSNLLGDFEDVLAFSKQILALSTPLCSDPTDRPNCCASPSSWLLVDLWRAGFGTVFGIGPMVGSYATC
jgi:hypothetical protein